jgi:hypothetical protein
MMPTIVEYSDREAAVNAYPTRIVSPPRPGRCCSTEMEEVGTPRAEGRWAFRYKRCRSCGFSVREIVDVIPDAELIADLRQTLTRTMRRW